MSEKGLVFLLREILVLCLYCKIIVLLQFVNVVETSSSCKNVPFEAPRWDAQSKHLKHDGPGQKHTTECLVALYPICFDLCTLKSVRWHWACTLVMHLTLKGKRLAAVRLAWLTYLHLGQRDYLVHAAGYLVHAALRLVKWDKMFTVIVHICSSACFTSPVTPVFWASLIFLSLSASTKTAVLG